MKRLNVSQIFVLAFLIIILFGGILLTLPAASKSGQSCGFLPALFTSASATCVTGLALFDTCTGWSLFGQIVILILIETGGLGFMSVASIVFFALKKEIDISRLLVMAQSIGADNMDSVLRIQKKMLAGAFIMEGIGAIILALRFSTKYPFSKSLWLGIFHSVSAFCNAGFDILGFIEPGASIIHFNEDTVICLTIAFLIIIGGIGFIVWDDIASLKHYRRWSIYTRLVIITTSFLLISGTLLILYYEGNNPLTLGSMDTGQKLLNAFFQSASTRTAGFASFDQGAMNESGKLCTIVLMFIGGASGSTAGGLKVVTFTVIVAFLISSMRGKSIVNMLHRQVPDNHIVDALTLFCIMGTLSFAGGFLLSRATGIGFTDTLFEAVSALATVGLSTGLTGSLKAGSQILLIIYMFFGRVGILTLSLGFLQDNRKTVDFKYPTTSLLIG